ncbi:MAG: hypothetical protein KA941_03245 [Flavobacteriales bacterium]|nr:hypothetical protein [Flavobacteriales bacterium]
MNTNWAKILLFSLLSFALGMILCCLLCHRCGGGGNCHGGGCGKEMNCHGGMSMCEHGGSCCSGEGSHCDKGGCDHKMGASCCKGGGHGMGHGMGHGDENVRVIVKELEGSNFQGDTTISIDGGEVNVSRTGDSTTVRVEMKKEVELEHAH